MSTQISQETSDSLISLLNGLSASDNTIRTQAERSLNHHWLKKGNVDVLLLFLAYQSVHGQNEGIKSFSAVLFRRLSLKAPNEEGYSVTSRQIDFVSSDVKSQIRSLLLEGFSSTTVSRNVRHKIADAIAEVAKDKDFQWDNLLPTIFNAIQSQDSSFKESAFRIVSTTPEIIADGEAFSTNPSAFLNLFNIGFQDDDDDTKVSACSAFVAFFDKLPKSTWSSLNPLLPNLLNSLPKFLEGGKDTALASVLESLIELVSLAPKMFKPMFSTIIQFCSQVVQTKDLDSSARLGALELLTTFSEYATNMCKREPSYSSTMVVITLQLMTEVGEDDDDCAEWNNNDDLNDEDYEEEFSAARQSLDRVSLRVGGQSLAAPLFQYLPQMLQSDDWRKRQASLMALSSAVEGCKDVLIGEIPRILDLIIPSLQDPNPRVQHACCNALGQISTDFSDLIQRTAGDRILPALISMLNNKNVPRVQTHAAAALVNFSEVAPKQVLEPYLDDIFTNLLTLLQSPKRYVQEQVVTTIAIVADVAEDIFVKYYDTLMPLLINVLSTDMGEENRLLKAKSVECASMMASAVGREKFLANSQELLTIFSNLQDNLLGEDDPVNLYLELGWSRICSLLGKDFLVYLPKVIPPLMEVAKAAQDVSIVDEEDLEELNQNEDYDVFQVSGKHVAIHTALLDDKATAIDLLKHYAQVLDADFFRFVGEIANEVVLPGLNFYLHDGVRASSAASLPYLLKCVVSATGSNQSSDAVALWRQILEILIKQIEVDPVAEVLVTFYSSLTKCAEIMGPHSIPKEQLVLLAKSITANLVDTADKMLSRDEENDEYAEEAEVDEDDYTDEELLDEITKNLSLIFKNARGDFLYAFQLLLLPTIDNFLKEDNSALKLFGVCAISDLIEFTGPESYAFKDVFMHPIGESLTSSHASIRQAAAYCVGVCAQYGGAQYMEFCIATLPMMLRMVSVPDAKAEENLNATENITATIAKICHSFGSSINDFQTLLENWIRLLPVIHDDEAAPYVYSFLAELMNSQNPVVMSQIPKVTDDVIEALNYNSIAGKTAETVITATKNLLGQLSQDEVMMIINKYPDETKQAISKWFA